MLIKKINNFSRSEIEQQMETAFHQGERGIPLPNLDGLESLSGTKPYLGLIDPEDTHLRDNKARPRGGYRSADRTEIKTSIVQHGFQKSKTIPVVVKVGHNYYRRVNGVTRFSLYGEDGWKLKQVLVWILPNTISLQDEYVLSGRLNPVLPMQSPMTRKDAILMALELIDGDLLDNSTEGIDAFVESVSANPDDVNLNVRKASWKTQTKNAILREIGVGIGRYPTYTTDVAANDFYRDKNIALDWSKGKIVKVHGIREMKYLKPRTNHIVVRMNGADDHALATMDSLSMRRNHGRVQRGFTPLTTHVHIDIDITDTKDSVSQKRVRAQEVIYNFVKLMRDRGTRKFYWVVDGFYPKDKSVDDMNSIIEWKYNPSK